MIATQLTGFGPAREVLKLATLPRPEIRAGELLLEMLAAPVNPADLNVIEGKYGELPPLPAVIGNEGVGRVLKTKAAGFSVGDLVLPLCRGTWTQQLVVSAGEAIRLPAEMDVFQAAMMTINPPTALAMIEDFVALQPGDWVVQNGANSGVGRSVIQIARSLGLKTLNVVRRPELLAELKELGADVVVTEECDLRAEVESLCGGQRPPLALNAVGGASALNLANALADGGTHVTYGAMGRQPLKIPNGLLIFRRLKFSGFWLTRWRKDKSWAEQQLAFAALAELSCGGKLTLPVHRVLPFSELWTALEEAGHEGRAGKVLLDLTKA